MGFSEKMRDSLGAEGARLQLHVPEGSLPAGSIGTAKLTIVGGTRPALVNALTMRVIEADRHWVEDDGTRIEEQEAQALPDRRGLTAGWERRTIGQRRMELDREIGPGERVELDLEVTIPTECKGTTLSCSHMLNVQADIKGQIDPTGNARIVVGERAAVG